MNLASKRELGDAGYFRLGLVTLQIPPEDITTHKVNSDEEVVPLRAKFPMHQKSGHGRWDVTVHWKAIAESGDYSQWEDLRTVLAIFKAAPFVEVENAHLRQILMVDPESGTNSDARMAFGLRMLQIDTTPDIPMGLDVTLTMSWFNYSPFTYDFGYADADGMPVDAYQSDAFRTYIETWKKENLDEAPNPFSNGELASKYGYPDMESWKDQTPGSMKFTWRNYIVVPLEEGSAFSTPDAGGQTPVIGSGGGSVAAPRGDSGKTKLMQARSAPSDIKAVIVKAAESSGLDPYLCMAVSQRESGYNPSAKNPTSSASGLFQLISATAKQYQVNNVFDAQQNADGGCRYIRYLMNRYHNDTTMALTAFAAGEGNVDRRGLQGAWNLYPWIPGWLDDIGNIYTQLKGQPLPSVSTAKANASAFKPETPAPAPASKTPVSKLQSDKVPQQVIDKCSKAIEEGWSLDHFTDRAAFLYKESVIALADEEHGVPHADLGIYPTQTSVVLVNNLATIPLEAHQYPAYQHVGPAGTMLVVGFASNGTIPGELEPEHEGMSQISCMCSALNSQYRRLRGEWRSISAIHRMQSIIVENQVLNMLGIRGTLVKGWDTETVPTSSSLVQASLKLTQYENVFEEVTPFKVKGSVQLYKKVLENLMQPGSLEKLTKGKPDSVFAPLITYRDNRNNQTPEPLLKMLQDTSYMEKSGAVVPMPIAMNQTQLATLRSFTLKQVQGGVTPSTGFTGGLMNVVTSYLNVSTAVTWAAASPDVAARINAGTFSYNDYFLLVNSQHLANQPDVAAFRSQIEAEIKQKTAAGAKTPTEVLYDQVLDYQTTTSSYMVARALDEVAISPETRAQLKLDTQSGGPGSDSDNSAHGAYRDLGLKSINLGSRDFNPAYYFVDYGDRHRQDLKKHAGAVARVTAEALNTFNRKDATTTLEIAGQVNGVELNADPNKPYLADPTSTAEAILDKTTIPYLSMARAFPTFKLFLLEEDNTGPFFMFDDFYSYGSVLNIEITKSQNPTKDVAVITLTNFANLLSHRLYDGTAAGRKEKQLSNLQEIPKSSDGSPVVGGVAAKGDAEKSWLGVTRRRGLNLTQGFNSKTDSPLQYYPLQTGAKVQVRMGFSNDPDKLWPVFTGKVTQIEGEEIMQVVCQGYGIELTDPAPEDLRHDGFSLFGFAGPAYGGFTAILESGRTESVIESVLKTSGAKHFGHWQVDPGRNNSNFIKGFGWIELASKAIPSARVSNLLASGADRRGENVSINQYVNIDASITKARLTRGWSYESPAYFMPAYYHVPKDLNVTPWRIIKDISRRYSEYILTVKPYGFPVGADATLVFANPNDLYITRRPMGDSETIEGTLSNVSNDAAFRDWWHVRGWKRFQTMFDDSADARKLLAVLGTISGTSLDTNPVVDLTRRIDQGGLPVFSAVMQKAASISAHNVFVAKFAGADFGSKYEHYRKLILALMNDFQHYVILYGRRTNGKYTDPIAMDRIQPVRKWHLIGSDVIIHNGIRLNDQIFNAVKVKRDLFQANSSIPKFHLRTLDCDPMIIDPDQNADDVDLQKSYAQSFLREEVGKMYGGEIVLAGCPEIEPFDVLLIADRTTGMAGPVEVETVVHSFSQEAGFITIVTPRALVIMNEAMTAGLQAGLSAFASSISGELQGGINDIRSSAHPLLQGGAAAITAGGQAGIAVGGVVGAQALAGFLGVGMFVGLPVTLGALAVLGTIKLIWMADEKQDALPIFVSPLNRFGKPWVGGLEGWQLRDTHSLVNEKFKQMYAFEIAPTIEGFKRLNQIASQD